MCGIFATSNISDFGELLDANKSRGTEGWSVSSLNWVNPLHNNCELMRVVDCGGEPSLADLEEAALPTCDYFIVHLVTPTSRSFPYQDYRNHPAVITKGGDKFCLWHNGLIHSGKAEEWDTLELLQDLGDGEVGDYFKLCSVHGSFACIHLINKGDLRCFRNELSPLYYRIGTTTLSSTHFEGSMTLPSHIVYSISESSMFQAIAEFTPAEPVYKNLIPRGK